MLNEKLTKGISEQINMEMSAAYTYLGMAVYFEAEGLKGFAHWIRLQAKEEMDHAMKMYRFVFDAGSVPVLDKIDAPKVKYNSPKDVFDEVLKHEQKVSASVNRLYELALSEKEYKAQTFLAIFIDEQVEEESNMRDVLDKLKYANGSGSAIIILDNEMGKRV